MFGLLYAVLSDAVHYSEMQFIALKKSSLFLCNLAYICHTVIKIYIKEY